VSKLDETTRELLVLKFGEGLSNAEIRRHHGPQQGAIKSLYHAPCWRCVRSFEEKFWRSNGQDNQKGSHSRPGNLAYVLWESLMPILQATGLLPHPPEPAIMASLESAMERTFQPVEPSESFRATLRDNCRSPSNTRLMAW